MWTYKFALFYLFTDVTKMNKYARSCMFGENFLFDLEPGEVEMNMSENFGCNENVKSPKDFTLFHEKRPHTMVRPEAA